MRRQHWVVGDGHTVLRGFGSAAGVAGAAVQLLGVFGDDYDHQPRVCLHCRCGDCLARCVSSWRSVHLWDIALLGEVQELGHIQPHSARFERSRDRTHRDMTRVLPHAWHLQAEPVIGTILTSSSTQYISHLGNIRRQSLASTLH
jgi:hypothetical protein